MRYLLGRFRPESSPGLAGRRLLRRLHRVGAARPRVCDCRLIERGGEFGDRVRVVGLGGPRLAGGGHLAMVEFAQDLLVRRTGLQEELCESEDDAERIADIVCDGAENLALEGVGAPRAATAIECIDCHGTVEKRPTLVTSGNSGPLKDGKVTPADLAKGSTPWGPRFYWQGSKLFQRSMMSPDVTWEVPQTIDTVDPASPRYNAKSAYAKTLRRDGESWGGVTNCQQQTKTGALAHGNNTVSCQVCHSSWATSCFGCHLPMRANKMVAANKFEGDTSRNYTSYNPQVVRDDVFMLGRDATYKDNRLAVLRSSSAVMRRPPAARRPVWGAGS